jgi:hypothetical protein
MRETTADCDVRSFTSAASLQLTILPVTRQLSNKGFLVTYYAGAGFEKRRTSWTEMRAFRDYGTGRPSLVVRRDNRSAGWDGVMHVPDDGDYTFHAQSDDGLRLYVDGALLIDY